MNNTVFKRVFPINDYGDAILIAIHVNEGYYNYTVSNSDGPNGDSETLVPFLESKYIFSTPEEAFENAKYEYSDYEYTQRVNAYNKECEKFEKQLKKGKISESEYHQYIMLLSDKYNI